MTAASRCPGLSSCWHSSSGVELVAGVAQVQVGAMGEQPPDVGGPAVARRGVQRQPSPLCVGLVERGSGFDELVDGLQPLVVSGECQRADPALPREPGQRPARDISCRGRHLQAANAGSGGHQDVHDLGHAEHRSMLQGGAAGHAARVGCGDGDGVDVGSGLGQHLGDLGVAVAGRGDERGFRVLRAAVNGRAGVDQESGDGAGAGQPEPVVVEPQHGHVAERVSSELVVAPVLHLRGRQLRVLGQQPGQPGQIAAVEDVAAFDFEFELGPAGEAVLAGQRQLRRRQDDAAGDRADAHGGFRVTALGGAQQIPGLVAELVEVGPGRSGITSPSSPGGSAAGPKESVIYNGLLPASGGGLCPARGLGGALPRLVFIVSALTELGTVADGRRVADPEQSGEPERVAAGGLAFGQHSDDQAAGRMPIRSTSATASVFNGPVAARTSSTATPRVSGE
jgi:hypothetical protein